MTADGGERQRPSPWTALLLFAAGSLGLAGAQWVFGFLGRTTLVVLWGAFTLAVWLRFVFRGELRLRSAGVWLALFGIPALSLSLYLQVFHSPPLLWLRLHEAGFREEIRRYEAMTGEDWRERADDSGVFRDHGNRIVAYGPPLRVTFLRYTSVLGDAGVIFDPTGRVMDLLGREDPRIVELTVTGVEHLYGDWYWITLD